MNCPRSGCSTSAIATVIPLLLVCICSCKEAAEAGNVVGFEGGTFEFPGSIVMEIPPGAFGQDTQVSARPLEIAEVQGRLDEAGNVERHFLAGVTLEPSGPLGAPITLTMPLQRTLEDAWLPIHYRHDPTYDAYYPAVTSLTVSPDGATATVTLTEFSEHVIAGVGEVLQRDCGEEEPCRCGLFSVEETARERSYSRNDCQASEITGSITYHECGVDGFTEYWLMVEHTEGCVPKLALSAEPEQLLPGETSAVRAEITFLGDPVEGVPVELTSNDLIDLNPTSPTTNESGGAASIATAGNREGVAPVEAKASWTYPSTLIAVNGVEQEVVMRTKTMSATTEILVVTPWIGDLELSYWGCRAWRDAELTDCVGFRYSFSVEVAFQLYTDTENTDPRPSNPNVFGSGLASISNVASEDGPLIEGGELGNCQTTGYQSFADEILPYPFPVSIVGLRRNDVRFLFGHPSGGSEGLLVDITGGEREYCDGELFRETLTENAIQVYWNPAIVFEWDPDWGDDPGFRVDLDGRTSVTDTGECGSMYTGEYGGEGEGCTYRLTMQQAGDR